MGFQPLGSPELSRTKHACASLAAYVEGGAMPRACRMCTAHACLLRSHLQQVSHATSSSRSSRVWSLKAGRRQNKTPTLSASERQCAAASRTSCDVYLHAESCPCAASTNPETMVNPVVHPWNVEEQALEQLITSFVWHAAPCHFINYGGRTGIHRPPSSRLCTAVTRA